MSQRRNDGYKKIDKVTVNSELEGSLVFPLYFNAYEKLGFCVRVDDQDVFAATAQEIRAKVEEVIKERASVIWERWIEIDYSARVRDVNGHHNHLHVRGEKVEVEPGDYIDSISFDFEVYDISSLITLSKEARDAHRRNTRWSDAPIHERLLKRLTWNADTRVWVHEEGRKGAEHVRVDADHLERAGHVTIPYSEEKFAALLTLRAGFAALDAKLREVIGSPNIVAIVALMQGLGGPLALPASEVEVVEQPTKKRRKS